MKLKSYFADSVEAAVNQASKELGPEAMLVYSREAPPEARYLGAYEVVFAQPAVEQAAAGAGQSASAAPVPGPAEKAPESAGDNGTRLLLEEITALRRQVERVAASLARSQARAWGAGSVAGPLAALIDTLLAAGLAPELLEEMVSQLRSRPEFEQAVRAPDGTGGLARLFRAELATKFSVDGRVGRQQGGARVIALVGPPGAGKTSALVKIAAAYGLKTRRPAQLLSMDMYRVGAAEQLRSFAAILGVGFQALETPGALAQALEEHRQKDLVLIDTPGHSERDMEVADEVAAFLRSRPEIDVHLTLTASMKTADLKRAVDRYERFGPAKLLFTKLDETSSPGSILNEAIRTEKPVSFLADGQRIPEDIREATREEILALVLGRGTGEAESAADADRADPVLDPLWEQSTAGQAVAA